MRTRKAVLRGSVAVVTAAILLAGCTSGDDVDAQDSGSESVAKTAPAQGGVLAEQTIDAPTLSDGTPHGGTMTVTVRSVTVTEGVTQLTWAARWDNPDAAGDASFEADDFFFMSAPPTLIDGAALKLYYPLCPDRDWHDTTDRDACGSLGRHGLYQNGSAFTNHKTTEAWAVFPGLEEGTTTVNLTLPSGLPPFVELPVTWA